MISWIYIMIKSFRQVFWIYLLNLDIGFLHQIDWSLRHIMPYIWKETWLHLTWMIPRQLWAQEVLDSTSIVGWVERYHNVSLDLELLVSCFSFDIHCWWWNPKYDPLLQVRLLRTNLREKDVQPVKEQLAQSLFDHIPVSRIGIWKSVDNLESNR